MSRQEEDERFGAMKKIATVIANGETVQRYGTAAGEHVVAYSGVDGSTGQVFSKSLKGVADSKVHPDYVDANLNQQAGFSAEIKTTARENADKILRGEKTRTTRTDDMKKQSNARGGTIGGTNDQLADCAEIDANGNFISGTDRQLKYVGENPDDCMNKLLDKKYDKYRDNDVAVEVPADFYEPMKEKLAAKEEQLGREIERAKSDGKLDVAKKKEMQLERVKKANKTLRKGNLTKKEALEARTNPVLSTAKDIGRLAHKAGVKGAETGAKAAGGIALVTNMVDVIQGKKSTGEAVRDIAKSAAGGAAVGYITTSSTAALTSVMQRSTSEICRALSKTNAPALVITSVMEVGNTVGKFLSGKITGEQCLMEIGEKGMGFMLTGYTAAVGQALIPIPVVGAMIGSMVGGILTQALSAPMQQMLAEKKLARERRIAIERECEIYIEQARRYQAEFEEMVAAHFARQDRAFAEGLFDMRMGEEFGDVETFIRGANRITEEIGGKAKFETMDEFDLLMGSDAPLKL